LADLHRTRKAFGLRRGTAVAIVALLTAASAVGMPVAAAAAQPAEASRPVATVPATPGPIKPGYSKLVENTAVVQPTSAAAGDRHTVFVRLGGQGAAWVSADLLAKGAGAAEVQGAVRARLAAVSARARAVSALAVSVDPAAVTIFSVANAVPGVGLTADTAALRALARMADVEKISEIIPKTPANAGAAALTRVLQT